MKILIVSLILVSLGNLFVSYRLGKRLNSQQKVLEKMANVLELHSNHVLNLEHTDSLLVANVNKIYKLLDVEWEIRLEPDSTDKVKDNDIELRDMGGKLLNE